MRYILDEKQYRQLMANIYMNLKYDNYKKCRVFKLMFGKKIDKRSGRVEKQPRLVISYERLQMFGNEDESLTLTFDTNFKWWTDRTGMAGMSGSCFRSGSAVQSLSGRYIMGIKSASGVPAWLTEALGETDISRQI